MSQSGSCYLHIYTAQLFDFNLEVKPILEVLVGKTLEQSLMEVMEEEELDALRDHQREYEELRTAELIETQRMEEQARRRHDEKNRRIKQQQQVALAEKETAEKIAARTFARVCRLVIYLVILIQSRSIELSQSAASLCLRPPPRERLFL